MSTTQAIIYKTKSMTRTSIGRGATKLIKIMAGAFFDVFIRTYKTGGLTFIIPRQHTTMEMRGKFAVDTYELPERELARRYLDSGATVLEMGGCIGVVSCTINKQLKDRRRHVVLEANPELIPAIIRNRDLNGCEFSVRNNVISREASVWISTDQTMDSNSLHSAGGGAAVEVFSTSVGKLESEEGYLFDTVVMDIEGAEYDFLRENREFLPQLKALFVEMHPHILSPSQLQEIRDVLNDAGLRKIDEILTVEYWGR